MAKYSKKELERLYETLVKLDGYADTLRVLYNAPYRVEEIEEKLQGMCWDVVDDELHYTLDDLFEEWAGIADKTREEKNEFYDEPYGELLKGTKSIVRYIDAYPYNDDQWDAVKIYWPYPVEFLEDLENQRLISFERDDDRNVTSYYITYGDKLKEAAGL